MRSSAGRADARLARGGLRAGLDQRRRARPRARAGGGDGRGHRLGSRGLALPAGGASPMKVAVTPPLHITVMLGGFSAEREVSLKTGSSVARALRSRGHQVDELDPKDEQWSLPPGTQ